jgi:hypothetical protein
MRRFIPILTALMLTIAAGAQTLKITTNSGTKEYQASQVTESEPATFTGGTMLSIGSDVFNISDITSMLVTNSSSSDVEANTVNIVYNGSTAMVTMADNVAAYVSAEVSGAHVSITQTNTDTIDGDEITYVLSGSTTDGSLTLDGSYKCTISLTGVTMTNPSGAAINITNKKRIQLSVKNGTENTLTDGSDGSQKACIYSKGQLQLQGKGTLNVVGNYKHGIKSASYITIKNLTLNITSTVSDGINCEEYFQMKSGVVTISGVGDDGIQCDLGGTTSTGETTDHDDEDSGNVYLEGGTLNITTTAAASKGIKADGSIAVSDGTYTISTTGSAAWDSDDNEVKACAAMSADGNMTISGGTLTLSSTGAGGKAISVDGTLTISGGVTSATTTGQIAYCQSTSNTTIRTTTSSSTTERLADALKTSPKAIKADGAMTISGGTTYAKASYHEAVETKSTLDVTGGVIYAYSADDAINSASTMTLSGGYVGAYSTGNDAIDSNGNLYIKGATVFAYTTKSSPEVAIDSNTEGGYKLYVQSGTLYAYPSLESGSSLTQSCYTASLSTSNWYSFAQSGTAFAFKVPASGTWIVSGGSSLYSVSKSDGTTIFDSYGATDATVSSGSSVNLSSYTGGGSGPGGGGFPGGGGPGGWH